jgi:hypothetical protein
MSLVLGDQTSLRPCLEWCGDTGSRRRGEAEHRAWRTDGYRGANSFLLPLRFMSSSDLDPFTINLPTATLLHRWLLVGGDGADGVRGLAAGGDEGCCDSANYPLPRTSLPASLPTIPPPSSQVPNCLPVLLMVQYQVCHGWIPRMLALILIS